MSRGRSAYRSRGGRRRGGRARRPFWALVWAGAGFTVGARLGVWLWRLLVLAAIVGGGIVVGVIVTITQSVPAERRIPLTIGLLGVTVLGALGYRWLTSQSWGRTVLCTAGAIVALAGAVLAVRGI